MRNASPPASAGGRPRGRCEADLRCGNPARFCQAMQPDDCRRKVEPARTSSSLVNTEQLIALYRNPKRQELRFLADKSLYSTRSSKGSMKLQGHHASGQFAA